MRLAALLVLASSLCLPGLAPCQAIAADWQKPVRSFMNGSGVYSVAVMPDGKRIVSASGKTVILWDIDTDAPLRQFEHEHNVIGVAVTPDGERIVSKGSDATITLWDLGTGELLRRFKGHNNVNAITGLNAMAVTPDGERIVSESDRTIILWDLGTGKLLRRFKGHNDDVNAIAVTPDGKRIVSGGRIIILWDLRTGALLRRFVRPSDWGEFGHVTSITVTPDGKRIVVGYYDRTITLWDLETGKLLRRFDTGEKNFVLSVAVTPDGKYIVSGTWHHVVILWNLETGAELGRFKGHRGTIGSVAVTSDGERLVSGSSDGTIKLWHLPGSDSQVQMAEPAAESGEAQIDKDRAELAGLRERLAALEQQKAAPVKPEPNPGAAPKPAFDPGKRIALVIGNSAYQHARLLQNPANDAKAVAESFRRLGFAEVIEKHDLNLGQLSAELKSFSDRALDADWAVIYFAGHGVEVDRANYLIPVDAELKAATHVDFEAVPLDRVIGAVAGAKAMRLVILDACRDNPFVQKMAMRGGTRSVGRGLSRVEPQDGVLVAYAAADGQVALDGDETHSPFAAALLQHLEQPGLEVGLLFRRVATTVRKMTADRQVPFTYGSLTDAEFYFNAAK